MASLRYASGSEYADLKALRMLCCKFGKYTDPEIVGMTQQRTEKCSDDAATDLHQTME
jgi:hypothetical protein